MEVISRLHTYKTMEIAGLIGIHPNTVRLYEKLNFIPTPKRQPNGYRIFTDIHLQQLQLARTALKVEVLQNGLRQQAINIIKSSAAGDFPKAIHLTKIYLQQIGMEQKNADEAIMIVKRLLSGVNKEANGRCLTRKETADYLQVSVDTLRNWELNGLLSIKRKQNGYRIYTEPDLQLLKIIRSLRCANYSLSAILRMLRALSGNPEADLKEVIDTPGEDEDIITACDKLLTSLSHAKQNARNILAQLNKMQKTF